MRRITTLLLILWSFVVAAWNLTHGINGFNTGIFVPINTNEKDDSSWPPASIQVESSH